MQHKRARTGSGPGYLAKTISHDSQEASIEGELMDRTSRADGELRARSRKLPESSRASIQRPREDVPINSGSPTYVASTPSHCSEKDMKIPNELGLSEDDLTLLQRAMREPPVTTRTLHELDLECIMGNANLRVDINFDHDLHFMPIKGRRGDRKRLEAQRYWSALALELQIYSFAARQPPAATVAQLSGFKQRLPQMFEEVKELLMTLIPDVEQEAIRDSLDVPLLIQQIEKGVLDIARLARWLAQMLKSHCAPMRDAWADEMVKRVEEGLSSQETRSIVQGLEKLFSILEAMKLDVANHQIRAFRLFLIEDTVSFQRSYFERRIRGGKMNLGPSRRWYYEAQQQHFTCNESTSQEDGLFRFASLIHGLASELITPQGLFRLPATFQYDRAQLYQLRADVQNIIHLNLCCSILCILVADMSTTNTTQPSPETLSNLRTRLLLLLSTDFSQAEDHVEEVWHSQTPAIALELVRAAAVSCDRNIASIRHEEVTRVDECLLRLFRGQLGEYHRVIAKVHEEVENAAVRHAVKFQRMSSFGVAEAQKRWKLNRDGAMRNREGDGDGTWEAGEQSVGSRESGIDGIARRIAHIGVLNWAVFSGLVYTVDEESEEDNQRREALQQHGIDHQNVVSRRGHFSRRSADGRLEGCGAEKMGDVTREMA